MKTRVHNRHAALRIFAELLFVFMMANATVANASPPEPDPDNWTDQGNIGTKIESGSGTSADPYLITSAAQLAYLAKQVNEKATTLKVGTTDVTSFSAGFPGIYFKIPEDVDINLSAHYWTPIGKANYPFQGIFDGNGRTVSGLKIKIENTTDVVYAGLFGVVQDGTIQNLGVKLDKEGIEVSSTQKTVYAGGIAGALSASGANPVIRNCYVEAEGSGAVEITGTMAYAGGIAGQAQSNNSSYTVTITHCYATVNVEATASSGNSSFAGGIVGDLTRGTLSYTYATGMIEAKADGNNTKYVGGICGGVYVDVSKLENCLALNEAVIAEGDDCGRIIGYKDNGTASSNYANPAMKLNGKTIADSEWDGTSTWLDKLKGDLMKEPATDNGWDKAWVWPTNPDALPQLKKVKVENDATLSYTSGNLSGQTTRLLSETPLTQSPWSFNVADKIDGTNNGDGTSGKPILIKDAAELAYFAQQVNKGEALAVGTSSITNSEGFKDKYFALSADIDLSGHDWTPIGNAENVPFKAHFDGQGHIVKGLKIKITDATGAVFAGLFGRLADGTIQNLGVRLAKEGIEASSTNETTHAGGIAGIMIASGANATIRNCYVEAENGGVVKVTGTGADFPAYAGGIVGQAYANSGYSLSLTHCYTTVDVEATANGTNSSYAGGIAGFFLDAPLSYTYATGKIEAKGNRGKYAGGICGAIGTKATLTNSLALNKEISGNECGRITGYNDNPLSSNYANPAMTINGQPVADEATKADESTNGSSTCLDLFVNDLKGSSLADEGWNSGNWKWDDTPNSTQLPQLKVVTIGADGSETYSDWQAAAPAQQPTLYASVLKNAPKLHIVQPTDGSGTLTVSEASDPNNTPLTDDTPLRPGTRLNLSSTPKAGYDFKNYLSGSSAAAIDQTATSPFAMTLADLWLSASFSKTPEPVEPIEPIEPEPKVYHTVTLPAVEGATTDPAPGDYEVEAWDTFRFYLTLDEAYNLSTPIVTTDRGETLSPRTSDGAYLVKYVRSDVEIFIEGIEPNNPVGNEAVVSVSAPRIWSADGTLHIRTDAPTDVRIYTFDGSLRRAFRSDGGEQTLTLSPGSYIVVVGDVSYKVML